MSRLLSIFRDQRAYMGRLQIESKSDGYVRFNTPRAAQVMAQPFFENPDIKTWLTVKARKAGISTHTQSVAQTRCHTARQPYRVAVGTNHQSTTDEWIRRAEVFRDGFPDFITSKDGRGGEAPMQVNKAKSEVHYHRNRSQMKIATMGGNADFRGGTYHLGICDELQSWVDAAAKFASFQAALTEESQVWKIGTPNGPGTYFHSEAMRLWRLHQNGDPAVHVQFIPWYDDPDYLLDPPKDWEPDEDEVAYALNHGIDVDEHGQLLAVPDMRRLYWRHNRIWGSKGIGQEMFRREYPSTFEEGFLQFEGGWFDAEYLNEVLGMLMGTEQPEGVLRIFHPPQRGETYAIGVDPSWCSGGDYFASQVLSSRGVQMASLSINKGGLEPAVAFVAELAELYNNARVLVESNKGGAGFDVVRMLDSLGVKLWSDPEEKGFGRKDWTTHKGSKERAASHLRQMVNGDALHLFDLLTVQELMTVREENGRIEGQGDHDDLFMALALAEWNRMTLPGAHTVVPRRRRRRKVRSVTPTKKLQRVLHG